MMALKFIMDPFLATAEYFIPHRAIIENMEAPQLAPVGTQKLSFILALKIQRFIAETFQIDSSKYELFISGSMEDSPAGAIGSLKLFKKFAILFSHDYVEELENQKRLKDADKFIIAHEVAHIIADDPYEGRIEILENCPKYRLTSFAVVGLAFTSLSYGIIPSYLIACGSAKLVGYLCESAYYRAFELRADTVAAQKSNEIAKGGIDFCSQKMDEVKFYRSLSSNKLEEWLINRDTPKYGETIAILCAKGSVFARHFMYDSLGNNRLDWTHPPLSERKKNIERILNR